MKLLTKKYWNLKRHPFFYYVRYILLSRNHHEKNAENIGCLNDINNIEDVPALYFEVNTQINVTPKMGTFEKALEIGAFLRNTIKGGPGLGLSSDKTLEKMLAGNGGVCSDFSQIFNLFCFINSIKVKEWGCVDRLYDSRFGHAFNEIYSTEHQKWIAIDIHKGIYFTAVDGKPLSTIELFKNLRNGKELQFTFISDYQPNDMRRIHSVYSKSTLPFVISNYKNKENDYFLNKYHDVFPSFLINFMLILLRKNHNFVFVMDNYKVKLLPKSIQSMKLIATE
ncbi:MAG TPA: hypothetical protein VK476_02620 [Flavobacterium sp.]|nr:hypothetical protein [Flavobacterium sp.]